jgi:hypothetical protein
MSVRKVLAVLFLGVPLTGWADQWVMPVTPTQVVSGNNGGLYIQILTSEAIVNPGGCQMDSYIVRDPALTSSAAAIALAALTAGRQLRLYVLSTCDGPTGRPLVSSLGMM